MNYKEENDRLFNDFLNRYFCEPFRRGEQSIEFIISPRCNLNCFPAGTMIRMADYTEKRIEDIEVGDEVMGFPEYPSRSDPMRPQCSTVTTLFHSETFELIRFTFEDGTELVTTPDHPILVKSKCERSGRYRLAKKFKVGQEAVCIALPPLQDANDIGLVRLDWVVKLFGTKKICCIDYPKCYIPEPLYNLETTTHTYIANGVLVHNCNYCYISKYRGIDDWKRNFDWFQEMYAKHGIEWGNLYLLQVRNAGWTPEQNKSMYDFLRHLIDFAWDKCGHNYNEFACFMSEGQRGFTILSEIFTTCSRGIGCGMQASFGVA